MHFKCQGMTGCLTPIGVMITHKGVFHPVNTDSLNYITEKVLQLNETLFDEDSSVGPAESGQNQEQEEKALPPLASNGDINLWIDEDKNGDVFLRVDAPFLESEPVFFNDVAKPMMNKFVEQWREQRDEG